MPAPELLQVPGSSRTCFMHHVIRLLGVADPFARCQIIRRLSNTASFTRGGCSWLQPALRRAVQMVVLETESGANFGIDDWIRTLISECKIPQTSRGVSRKDDRSPPTASLVDPATQAFPRLGVVLHHCVTCSDAMQLSPARGLAMASPEPMLFWLIHSHGSSTSLSPSTTRRVLPASLTGSGAVSSRAPQLNYHKPTQVRPGVGAVTCIHLTDTAWVTSLLSIGGIKHVRRYLAPHCLAIH